MRFSFHWLWPIVAAVLIGFPVSSCTRWTKPKSLLIITMDTTRADHLGPYGYSKANTPTIGRLASEGTLYERAYAVTPETLPSHASIFTGFYPPSHGVRLNLVFRLPEEAVTLAEIFRKHGFHTVAVHAAAVLDQRYGLNQGFDIYDGPGSDSRDPRLMRERSAEVVTEKALSYLAQREERPYFLWVHYYDPHSPFEPRSPFEAAESIPSESPELYDLEIAYTDYWIGKLLDAMTNRGDLEDTLIVFTGDHGESLGDHGEAYHTLFIYDSTIHVPLILVGPGVPAGKRVEDVVSSVDLFSTLLAAFGIETPPTSSRVLPGLPVAQGSQPEDRFAYSDSMTPPLRYGWNALEALRTKEWLYVRAPNEELYILDGTDPDQEVNLSFTEKEKAAELRRSLVETMQKMPRTGLEEQTSRQPTEKEMRELAALGYIAGSPEQDPAEPGSGLDPKDMVEVAEAFQLASLANRLDQEDVARDLLSWAAQVDPDNFGVWVQLGRVLFQEEKYTESIEALGRALELRPNSWEVLVEMATAEEELGDLTAAGAKLGEALKSSPFPTEVWRKLGRIRLQQRDWKAAADAYRELLEIDPNDQRALQALDKLEQQMQEASVRPGREVTR